MPNPCEFGGFAGTSRGKNKKIKQKSGGIKVFPYSGLFVVKDWGYPLWVSGDPHGDHSSFLFQ